MATKLLIYNTGRGNLEYWYAALENNPREIKFAGSQAPRLMARIMASGDRQLLEQLIANGEIFDLSSLPVAVNQVYTYLFANTSGLEYGAFSSLQEVFTASEGLSVADQIISAGLDLLEAIGPFAVASETPVNQSKTSDSSKDIHKEKAGSTENTVQAVIPPDYSISILNETVQPLLSFNLNRSLSSWPTGILYEIVQSPSATLLENGASTLGWYQIEAGKLTESAEATLVYQSQTTDDSSPSFGIQLVVPRQVAGLGDPPFWRVSIDGGTTWQTPSDPSAPYSSPAADFPCTLYISAQAGHSGLVLNAQLTDKVGPPPTTPPVT